MLYAIMFIAVFVAIVFLRQVESKSVRDEETIETYRRLEYRINDLPKMGTIESFTA